MKICSFFLLEKTPNRCFEILKPLFSCTGSRVSAERLDLYSSILLWATAWPAAGSSAEDQVCTSDVTVCL